jgi:methylglutaconyl-CoA hydratase
MTDVLLTEMAGGVLTLTLNRPDKLNAINTAMLDGLAEALARAELDAAVRAVVIRGAGKDFCAGADLDELLASVALTVEENERAALALGEIYLTLRRLPKPTVAAIHGRALAGGAGLALACDVVLASETSQFGFPEIRRGFVPAMVMTLLRRSTGEKRAFDLVATGRVVGAAEALAMGLVSRVYTGDAFDADVAALATELATHAGSAFALTKQLFAELDDRSVEDGILLGARVNAMARTTPDFRRAVQAFLDR